jgi:sulfur-carrier protein adenylyltransferase/sulfurtransferase
MSLSTSERVRYSRHLALREIGIEGQEKIRAARVLLIGAGGLGSPAALYLAAAGVGTVGIVDHDRVDVSNLQRQVLYGSDDIGQPKAHAAARRLSDLNPHVHVGVHDTELNATNVMSIAADYDIVLDGTDRFTTRYLSNDACVILRKPLVAAAIHRFEGQAMTYVPDEGPCYRCLFPEPPADELVPNCAEAGVLGVLPGVMGALQATEALKLIVGAGDLLIGRLLTYDALNLRFDEFRFARRSDCAVCGDAPRISVPQDLPEVCSAADRAAVDKVSARELSKVLAQTAIDAPLLIVDVREPHEFAVAHLPAAINIPLKQLGDRIGELSNSRKLAFVCRSGARSLTAAGLAHRLGVRRPLHLEGGLLAWQRDVDVTFEVAPVA